MGSYLARVLTQWRGAWYNGVGVAQTSMAVLLLAAFAFPATVTNSAPLIAPDGSRFNGKIIFKLNAAGNNATTAVVNAPVTVYVNNGNVLTNGASGTGATVTLVGNDVLQPANTTYASYWYNQSNNLVISRPYYIRDAIPFDISTSVPTAFTTYNISYLNPGSTNGNNTWSGINNFTNDTSMVTASVKCLNLVCFVDRFDGVDASVKWNACNAYVISQGGGVCDARGLQGDQSNLSQIIAIGEHAPPAGLWVTFIVPDHGNWTWAPMNIGNCLVTQYDHSSILGYPTGEGIQFQFLASGNTTSVPSVFCLDNVPASGGNYVRTEGFAANANGASITRAVFEWSKTFDHSVLRSVRANGTAANAPVKTMWIWGTCCGTSLYNVSGEGNGFNLPFYVGNPTVFGTSSTSFDSITGVNPPTGQSALTVDTGSTWTEYNTFNNVYTENHSADTTTAMIKIKASCCGPANGPNYFTGVRSGSDSGGATRYALDIDSGGKAVLLGTNTGVSANAINDHNTNGGTLSPGVNSNISFYSTDPIYSTGVFVSLGGTVANLPAAASNPGRMMYVTDSSAIASEGQNCAGGGAVKALAFSNGTVWKCF